MMLAERTFGEEFLPDLALWIFVRPVNLLRRVLIGELLQVGFERRHTFDFKADMIQRRAFYAGALKVVDLPGHDRQSYLTVGEIMIRVAGGFFQLGEIKDTAVKLADHVGFQHAQGNMADPPWPFLVRL